MVRAFAPPVCNDDGVTTTTRKVSRSIVNVDVPRPLRTAALEAARRLDTTLSREVRRTMRELAERAGVPIEDQQAAS